MEQFDDNRVSTHLLKLAASSWPTLATTGITGALLGGTMGYYLAPEDHKVLSTLLGLTGGGALGAGLGSFLTPPPADSKEIEEKMKADIKEKKKK